MNIPGPLTCAICSAPAIEMLDGRYCCGNAVCETKIMRAFMESLGIVREIPADDEALLEDAAEIARAK